MPSLSAQILTAPDMQDDAEAGPRERFLCPSNHESMTALKELCLEPLFPDNNIDLENFEVQLQEELLRQHCAPIDR